MDFSAQEKTDCDCSVFVQVFLFQLVFKKDPVRPHQHARVKRASDDLLSCTHQDATQIIYLASSKEADLNLNKKILKPMLLFQLAEIHLHSLSHCQLTLAVGVTHFQSLYLALRHLPKIKVVNQILPLCREKNQHICPDKNITL